MKKKFNVEGMTCAACQGHVKKAVEGINGISNVNVNLLKNTMDVEYDNNLVKDDLIIEAVKKAGYNAYLSNKKKEIKVKDHSLLNLIISIVFLLLLMYFSMGVMMFKFKTFKPFDMHESPMGFSLIQFILLLPIVYINRGYFIRGFKRLFKNPTMDSLIAIGATASILYSVYILFAIAVDPTDSKMLHMSLYFEAAGMILVFVSLGKYLENLSKRKTTKAVESLMDLMPKEALIKKDGKEITVDVSSIKVGDIVILKKGDVSPIDGIVVKGSGSLKEANITGESIPVYKKENDNIYSSTTLESGYLEIKATKVNEDTTFSQIISLVEEASNSKAPISNLADKISGIFVPIIFLIAALVFIGNFIFIKAVKPSYADNALYQAFNYAITVIVIACPCALGLATPVAIMVGTGKGAENGLIIKNAKILEQTGKIDTVVLDKTGTITNGMPSVTDITIDNETLKDIYSIELLSEHPLALAIIKYAKLKGLMRKEVTNYLAKEGMGLEGNVGNNHYYIGNKQGIKEDVDYTYLENEGKTVLYISKNDKFLGIIALRDEVKENSKEAIKMLNDMGIETIMLTGDNKICANAIAKSVGITKVISEVIPSSKASVIEGLKKEGKMVAMVGDGVNDAPALMSANLGIAIGSGAKATQESSDIVLVRNDLIDVVNAIRLSKRVLFTIKLGLFFAFFYNLICVFLASGILFHITKGQFKMKPEYGSMLMSISSVSVVLNALSINFFKLKRSENIENNLKKEEIKMATLVINVEGMMCKNCKAHVEKACLSVEGVSQAEASLENKNVTVTCSPDLENKVRASIEEAGYKTK